MSSKRRASCCIILQSCHGSIGTKRWDGTPVSVGYVNRMGNKEFEVDHEISRDAMPTITGASDEQDDDMDLLGSQVDAPLYVEASGPKSKAIDVDALPATPVRTKLEPPVASTIKKYVAPASSFYAPALPKKPKGPLFVTFLVCVSGLICS